MGKTGITWLGGFRLFTSSDYVATDFTGTAHECDRQTDRQTDGISNYIKFINAKGPVGH